MVLINAGGDLRVIGRNRDEGIWRMGVRHPLTPSRLLLSVLVEDEAAATSGNYFVTLLLASSVTATCYTLKPERRRTVR